MIFPHSNDNEFASIIGSANLRPLSLDTRLKVMTEAARGLAFLHSLA